MACFLYALTSLPPLRQAPLGDQKENGGLLAATHGALLEKLSSRCQETLWETMLLSFKLKNTSCLSLVILWSIPKPLAVSLEWSGVWNLALLELCPQQVLRSHKVLSGKLDAGLRVGSTSCWRGGGELGQVPHTAATFPLL